MIPSSFAVGANLSHAGLLNFPMNGIPAHFTSPLGQYLAYGDHFANYIGPASAGSGGGWILTETGSGSVALAAARGGILTLTTAGTNGNLENLQMIAKPWHYRAGKRMWFLTRVGVSVHNTASLFFGLAVLDTSLIASLPSDGIFFEKASTATKMDFHVRKNGTSTERTAIGPTLANAAITSFVLDNMVYFGFAVHGSGQIDVYAGPTLTTLLRVATIAKGDANIVDDEMLTLSFGVTTGASAARALYVDMAQVAMEI